MTKINLGPHIFAVEVADLHKDGCAEVVNVCHLPFSESGENLPIIMTTAISAWWAFSKTKDSKKIVYPSIPSSIAPVNHGPELSIPQPPTTHTLSSTSSEDDDADF